jgi:putative ABC transport system permease protein
VNPGFDAHHVLTLRVSLTGPEFETPARTAQVIREATRRIRALPGVEAAATACCVPLDSRLQMAFQIAGRARGPASGGVTGWVPVSAGYFETLRIPILRGRKFTDRDETGPLVAIVNESLANQFWVNDDPLNGQITIGSGSPMQIIGVAGDIRDGGLDREARPTLYVPSIAPGGLLKLLPWAWIVRTQAAPVRLSSAIQKELREASAGLPVGQVRTMQEILSRSTAAGDFQTLVMTIFGCSALLLASLGIYGLIAYTVLQRAYEIGSRLALGAQSGHIRTMILVQGVRPALAGVVWGLVAAFGLTRLLSSFLFGVKPWDPLVFISVPLILTGVAVVAVWLPALRASRIDPIQALRCE